jgi:hypothetical protein
LIPYLEYCGSMQQVLHVGKAEFQNTMKLQNDMSEAEYMKLLLKYLGFNDPLITLFEILPCFGIVINWCTHFRSFYSELCSSEGELNIDCSFIPKPSSVTRVSSLNSEVVHIYDKHLERKGSIHDDESTGSTGMDLAHDDAFNAALYSPEETHGLVNYSSGSDVDYREDEFIMFDDEDGIEETTLAEFTADLEASLGSSKAWLYVGIDPHNDLVEPTRDVFDLGGSRTSIPKYFPYLGSISGSHTVFDNAGNPFEKNIFDVSHFGMSTLDIGRFIDLPLLYTDLYQKVNKL